MRFAEIERKTKETDIKLKISLDREVENEIETGIGFFDHMLTALAVHSGISLNLTAIGDLYVDSHHTVEDTGIVLGKAFAQAIGEKIGINRFFKESEDGWNEIDETEYNQRKSIKIM